MIKVTNYEETCPYCGKTRTVISHSDDGYDYDGHYRVVQETTEPINKYCSCKAGQLLKDKCYLKPMCVNCKHLSGIDSCVNKKLIKSLNSKFNLFEIGCKISIKNVYDSCEFHELNEKGIILDLFTTDPIKNL